MKISGPYILNFLIMVFISFPCLFAQDEGYNYHSLLTGNPALAGLGGDGIMRVSYKNLYPGNGFNLNAVNLSFDGFFQSIHGGAGITISENNLAGAFNELTAGLSYGYHFRAGDDIYISAGLSFKVINRMISINGLKLPDQLSLLGSDVLQSAESLTSKSRTVPDFASGIIVSAERFTFGLSTDHLARPDLYPDAGFDGRLDRRYTFFGTADLNIFRNDDFLLKPVLYTGFSSGWFLIEPGVSLQSKYLALNMLTEFENSGLIDIKTGITLAFKGLSLFYTYRFNVYSKEIPLPVSISHSTGMAISLYFVDKRKTVKTIFFPEL